MAAVEFDSDSLGATEQFLNQHYTTMRIGNGVETTPVRSHIVRESFGTVDLDRLDLGFDMVYNADPLAKICLCGVETGWVEEHYLDEGTDTFGPGEIGVLTPPDLPYSGVIHQSRYTITMFAPAELGRIASTGPDAGDLPVEIIGHRPVSAAAGRTLTDAITHLREMTAGYPDGVPPLIAGAATQYLAASVLQAFPTTAVVDPTAADRRDAHPDCVRRALSYMESHVQEDISVADIAAAAYVTVRALQLAFRRHLDTTPMAYLKRMRLRGAHEQLAAATVDDRATVAGIAATWGFAHPGRFAALYREHYGRAPGVTLGADSR
ncbi:AraC-like DNA-binding protein [Nocardia transvalensis]|uniref:AraC-like DNA-binding protein n=1 Tax=Nocardia transvalensis TaxID=37333 RepID=A0A7W9PJ00_9NOCA|nr:helix-turn-helix transcriptional regulator [Nocardia transvalensis]MBB5916588.1 AraC-like DNA-binding protein [Nocardia transvalensis]